MKLCLPLWPALLMAQSSAPDSLAGSWINQDPENAVVTQVVVRRDGAELRVHAWGKCHPTDCDWGETRMTLSNGIPAAVWDHGFNVATLQLVAKTDGQLAIVYTDEYHDRSGRRPRNMAEFFAREKSGSLDPQVAAARQLLGSVAATYRNLKNVQFEVDQLTDVIRSRSVSRTASHLKVQLGEGGRFRVAQTGSGERSISISDGKTFWEFFPAANEYIQTPEGSQSPWSPVKKFTLLDQMRDPAQILRQERIDGSDCTVVRIGREGGVTGTLWIDSASRLVHRSLDEQPSERREAKYTMGETGKSFPPELFAFDPSQVKARDRMKMAHEAPTTLKGTPAPDFALLDLEGHKVQLSGLRGKPVLLDFWATWCGPCRDALPVVELLHRGLGAKSLVVLGVGDEGDEVRREFLHKFGYTFPSLHDPDGETSHKYGVGGIPTQILIDKDGKIAYYQVGSGDYEKMRDALREQGVW